ncbi:hypothetical protein SVIOM74S_07170 [Streptomyces violarus]
MAERTLTIAPPPFLASAGANSRIIPRWPNMLVSSSCRTASSEPVTRSVPVLIPALLMSSETSGAASAAALTDAGSAMSRGSTSTPGRSTVSGRRAVAVDLAGAPFEQALGEGAAQAAVGSGDKGDGVVDIHGRYAKT